MNPPDLTACKVEVPPLQAQVWWVHAGLTQLYFGIGQITEKIREPSFLLTREMSSLARVHSLLEPELGRGEPRVFGQRDTASVSWSGSVKLRARAHDEGLLPVRESVHACAAWLNIGITWAGSVYSIVVRS